MNKRNPFRPAGYIVRDVPSFPHGLIFHFDGKLNTHQSWPDSRESRYVEISTKKIKAIRREEVNKGRNMIPWDVLIDSLKYSYPSWTKP